MTRVLVFLLALSMMLGDSTAALAAKKRNEAPARPKAIYEAPMTVVIVRNSNPACEPLCPEWIAAEGEITPGTPAKFRAVLKQMGKKQLPIIIRSPGGSITAAIEIGRMIRKRKLDVAVGATQFTGCAPDQKACKLSKEQKSIYRGTASGYYSFCNSACPMILASGTARYASVESLVGVHKPRSESWQERVRYRETYRMVNGKKKVLKRTVTARKRVNHKVLFEFSKALRKQLAGYYREMGVDPTIMDDSEKAANQDMYYFNSDRMDALKLRTAPKSAGTLTGWIVCKQEPVAKYCVEHNVDGSTVQAKLALRSQPVPAKKSPMTFVIVRSDEKGCNSRCVEWIAAEGEIKENSADILKVLVDQYYATTRFVVLNSMGGSFDGALRLGRLIRQKGISVVVGSSEVRLCSMGDRSCFFEGKALYVLGRITLRGNCSGTCPLVLAGGVMRVADSAVLWSTRSYSSNASNEPIDVQLRDYFGEMKIDPKLYRAMKKLKKNSELLMDRRTMAGSRLVNSDVVVLDQDLSEACTSKESPARCVLR